MAMYKRNIVNAIGLLKDEFRLLRSLIPLLRVLGLYDTERLFIARMRVISGIVEDLEYELQKHL